MRFLKAVRAAVRRFWFEPCDPAPAGLFRIGFGLFIVALYAVLLPNWERYYGARGVLADAPSYGEWVDVYSWAPAVPALFWGLLGLAAALAFTVGFQTRLATVVLFLLELSRSHHGRFVSNGEDLVVRMLLFHACFAPLNRAWSLDAQRHDKEDADWWRPSVWPLRMMQVNLLLIYVLSLPNKLMDDEAWWNGDAVYWSIVSDMWGRWPWPRIFFDYGGVLAKLATFGTVAVEGLAPWLIWVPRTRLWAMAALVSMHLGIAIVLQNVTFFSLAMAVAFLLFLIPEEARAVVGVFQRWRGRLRPPAEAPAPVAAPLPVSPARPSSRRGRRRAASPQG